MKTRIPTMTRYEIMDEVIDPLFMRCLRSGDQPEGVLDFVSLWMLDSVASRSGLESVLVEEPRYLVTRISNAAVKYGFEEIAKLWDQATEGLDLAAEIEGEDPPFPNDVAKEKLEAFLLDGFLSDALVAFVKTKPDLFSNWVTDEK